MTRILAAAVFAFLFAFVATPANAGLDARIADALAARGAGQGLTVEFAQALPALPASAFDAARVTVRAFDPESGRFDALVETGAGAFVATGRARSVVEVPVLARDVPPGGAIAAADIVLVDTLDRPQAGTALRPEDLMGQAARRHLKAGRPVRLSDLQAPLAVRKGDMVTMIYEAPGVTLTAMGRAVAAGAVGDVIPVQNPQSMRTVEARVSAQGQVTVQAAGPRPAAPRLAAATGPVQ